MPMTRVIIPGTAGRQASIIGRTERTREAVVPEKAWVDFFFRDLMARIGGIEALSNTELADLVTQAQTNADAAMAAAIAADLAADNAMAAAQAAQSNIDALEAALLQQYATLYDQDADPPTLAYLGQALPGALTSDPAWRIQKLIFGVDGDVSTSWADGDSSFDNVWDDRATLTYS